MVPSSTFFHLPEEKRENLLRCARNEFARVPYPDASINRIIHAAGIPRGSFYMYFEDKADLFHHILSAYSRRLEEQAECLFTQYHGDLFSAMLAFFDYIQTDYRRSSGDSGYHIVSQIMRLNPEMRPTAFLTSGVPPFVRRLEGLIDRGRLTIASEGDLEDMLLILVAVTGPAILDGLLSDDPAPIRARYANILTILARGMAKVPEPAISHL